MTSKIKFKKISLIENRIVLSFKSKEEEIHFSEIDKVYIQINNLQPVYYLWFLLTSVVIVILSLKYLPFEIILVVPIFIIITGALKLHNRKIYELKICLKDGRFFKQEVPPKLKSKTIDTVNIIRREIFINAIK